MVTLEKRTVKVYNMVSSSGNKIANQFEIQTDDGLYFQSYDSIIAVKPNDGSKIILDEYYWDYSRTTGKYRNIFLDEVKADTQKKIDSGEYLLADLN
tara:strand:- start:21856 stop:22146 length:291 start_codon:yes stop_codon:yes gene_type:complete